MSGPPAILDLEDIGFGQGAHVLLRRALGRLGPGARLEIRGAEPAPVVDLAAATAG